MRTRSRLPNLEGLCDLAMQGRGWLSWYRQAEVELQDVAHAAGWNTQRLASILSLTSPRCKVARNVKRTYAYMAGQGFLRDIPRGIRQSVVHFERTGEIRGPKTRAFAAALLGDQDAIVLDVHMASLLGIDQRRFSVQAVRQQCERHVRLVAHLLGMPARETQAMLWAGHILRMGGTPANLDLLAAYRHFEQIGTYPR